MAAHFDIVIIGSGARGATLAQRLAPTGKSILILERGVHLPREADNWSPKSVFIDRKYRTREQWYDRRMKPFTPNCHYWVGGNTSFYGAALMRLRKGDFEQQTHGGGISPAWPIDYADLNPYYAEAERLWRVHGARGEKIPPNRRRRCSPTPARPWTNDPGIERLKHHFEKHRLAALLPAAGRQSG